MPCLVIWSRLTAVTDYGVSVKDVSGLVALPARLAR